MRKFFLIGLSAALLAIFAMPVHADDGQVAGAIIGAGVGGLLGNQFGHGEGRVAATTAGVVFGGIVGSEIGRSMDRAGGSYSSGGYSYAPGAVVYDAPYTPNYVAPDTPSPEAIYADTEYGSYCREFSQQINIGGQVRESYGTACLQPDGTWRVVQ